LLSKGQEARLHTESTGTHSASKGLGSQGGFGVSRYGSGQPGCTFPQSRKINQQLLMQFILDFWRAISSRLARFVAFDARQLPRIAKWFRPSSPGDRPAVEVRGSHRAFPPAINLAKKGGFTLNHARFPHSTVDETVAKCHA
jgi:hypothetical protein